MKINLNPVGVWSNKVFTGDQIKNRSGIYESFLRPKAYFWILKNSYQEFRIQFQTCVNDKWNTITVVPNENWFTDKETFVEVLDPVHITVQGPGENF